MRDPMSHYSLLFSVCILESQEPHSQIEKDVGNSIGLQNIHLLPEHFSSDDGVNANSIWHLEGNIVRFRTMQ